MSTKFLFLILFCPALIPTVHGQVNSWSNNGSGTFKWEDGSNWSLGVPPFLEQTSTLITNNVSSFSHTRTVSIDADTANNALGTMTISNLTLSIPSALNQTVLFVNNTGTTALDIVDSLAISNRCSLSITNSTLNSANFVDDGAMFILGGTLSVAGSSSIGYGGVGSLIQFGGSVNLDAEYIGYNSGSEGTLTVASGSHNVSILRIGLGRGATGTVWFTGGILNSDEDTAIGDFGVGSLIQSNGTLFTDGEFLGDDLGEGLLAIAGGTHTVGGEGLSIGDDGSAPGSVWLTDGALLVTNQGGIFLTMGSLTQSNGTLAASSETVGGFSFGEIPGDGTLTMAGGTHVVEFGGLTVSDFAGSTGTVWVTGGQLLATSFSNIIGADGVGSLVQSNGDVDMIFSEYVGYDAGAEGTLIVAGGTHTIEDGELTVGNNAGSTGTVWVTGGQLSSDSAVIGLAGVGQMIVSNGGWQVEDVSVGGASGGNGILTMAEGTSVISSDLTIGTPDCTGTGTVIVAGGSLLVTNAAHNAVLDLESGELLLSAGTLVVDQLVTNNPCGVFKQKGGTLAVGGVTNRFSPALFSITAVNREGNDMRISWQTPGGVTNAVQAANGGPNASYNTNFSDLSLFILGGSGEVTNTYIDPGGATNKPARYYRIRLVP